ncbi:MULTISPECIES: MFS transporter [Methylosinus]|uniref:NarK/NasA family nitrate transporter n=1 Tax=Methylosinus trichosporium (strain ATCC 35070 / NCIMB 11131 / UNIQEM 75 / OB3b) TaxID=595536 RepID=A0A2D2D450_METT3|nr:MULTISPECIES: MFS transporter [Methylosinus]ATQ69788.1 NarK/NasA family nitrate transporter [Methylosinus trichosporium OB3b]OBS52413.1 MFS transporter [Methylosinus sp. 3S-1]
MKLDDFEKAGHWPTLLAAFLYFDVSFMAWVSLGPLMIYIAKDMGLSVEDKLSLVAIPVLGGAFFRVPLGLLADAVGAKITGVIAQAVVIFAVSLVCVFGLTGPLAIALFGISLGVAGASFAVALPQAGRWYPPQYQGVVMGIAGAGNMGVVLDTLLAPTIAETYGWRAVYCVLLALMALVLIVYCAAAKDAPVAKKAITLADYGRLLTDSDSRWFMFFYFITFGGFVGLASALPLYFTTQYHATGVAAGLVVALIVAFGSGFRPVGGYIADRIGGVRTLTALFVVVSACYFAIALLPEGPAPAKGGWSLTELPPIAFGAVALFSLGVLALGMGNGAVFQLLPQRFRAEIGAMTGLVGAAGGLGGYFLAKTLAVSKGMTGGFTIGFSFFSLLALLGLVGLVFVKTRWRTTWGAVSGARI